LQPDNSLYLIAAGYIADTIGRYGEAESLYQRSLAIKEKALGKDHPDVAISLNNLAGLYDEQGKYDQAEPLFQRSLAIDEKALGRDHPTTKTVKNNLQQLQAHLKGQYQVQIKSILPNSQAEQVGLKLNDILLRYNNKPILGMTAFIYGRSLELTTNSTTELKVLRNDQELVFKIKHGKIGFILQEQVH
jgi:tetratricopeptide (TPR) repeat protein